jgi:DNA phosphorothioation-associated putative methyltransferase
LIKRHRTAIRRTEYSRPIRVALESGLISEQTKVFDYGCGQGDDLRRLSRAGIPCAGWDPHFRPNAPREPAPIVNLGFVVNVVEDPEERIQVLRDAWALTESVLLVAIRPSSEQKTEGGRPFSDGVLTARGTFQKFFDHVDFRSWVEGVLGVQAVSVEPGIVFVFRNPSQRHVFLSQRFRRTTRRARVRQVDALYERHRDGFDRLLTFWATRGRVPKVGEFDEEEFLEEVGSRRKAIHVLRTLVGKEEFSRLEEQAQDDLLVYLALDRFGGRPRFGDLPDPLKFDVRAHFGSYKSACKEADRLLFATGNPLLVDAECRDSLIGKLTPTALYVHSTAVPELSSVLRVYEGCARALVGEIPEANVIKLGRREPSVSYLSYPDFERDPHPVLTQSYKVELRSLKATFRDYRESENPPVLHRKELFLSLEDPLRAKFERLTKQEERWGLLDDPARIGTRRGWDQVLQAAGVTLKGHRVVRH